MAVDLLQLPLLGDVLGFLAAAFAGWRYLFSPSYRRRVHERWQSKSQLQIAQEIAAAVAGSLFWLVIFCLLISLFLGFDWITRLLHGTSSV
jgi:drug/metabolite transporter (DMT)-like permease